MQEQIQKELSGGGPKLILGCFFFIIFFRVERCPYKYSSRVIIGPLAKRFNGGPMIV